MEKSGTIGRRQANLVGPQERSARPDPYPAPNAARSPVWPPPLENETGRQEAPEANRLRFADNSCQWASAVGSCLPGSWLQDYPLRIQSSFKVEPIGGPKRNLLNRVHRPGADARILARCDPAGASRISRAPVSTASRVGSQRNLDRFWSAGLCPACSVLGSARPPDCAPAWDRALLLRSSPRVATWPGFEISETAGEPGACPLVTSNSVLPLDGGTTMRTWWRSFGLLFSIVLTSTATLRAQGDGDLDLTFGPAGNGTNRIPFDLPGSNLRDLPVDVAVAPDGRIFVLGTAETASTYRDAAIACLLPNGILDPAFGNGGKLVDGWIYDSEPGNVVILNNGDILVSYSDVLVATGSPLIAIRRFSRTGAPLPGVGWTPSGQFLGRYVGLVYDRDNGKIYVASSQQTSSGPQLEVRRFHENLTADSSFGLNGSVSIPHFLNFPIYLRDLAIDHLGRLVIGFTVSYYGNFSPELVRLTPSGQLDPTFGSSGYQSTGIQGYPGSPGADLQALAVDSRNRIVVSAVAWMELYNDPAGVVTRLLEDGMRDPTFNAGYDLVVVDSQGHDTVKGLFIESNGMIVVAGKAAGPITPQFYATRLDPDGMLDLTFGYFGVFRMNFPNSPHDDYAAAAALQAGKPILVGPAEWSNPDYDFGVLRLYNALIFSDDFESATTGAWFLRMP